jgi:hypothetical protein
MEHHQKWNKNQDISLQGAQAKQSNPISEPYNRHSRNHNLSM